MSGLEQELTDEYNARPRTAYKTGCLYDGPPITITPEGLRALERAKRQRKAGARRLLYCAVFMVAFAAGTALGLVLGSCP